MSIKMSKRHNILKRSASKAQRNLRLPVARERRWHAVERRDSGDPRKVSVTQEEGRQGSGEVEHTALLG